MRLARVVPLATMASTVGCALIAGLETIRFEADGDAGPEGGDDVRIDVAADAADADADAPRAPTCLERYDAGDATVPLFCDDFERTGNAVDGWRFANEEQGG